jgi:predicted nucleic acid-binding protein
MIGGKGVADAKRMVVLDTMCLMHYALADRLDLLGELLRDFECYSTVIVQDELHQKSRTIDPAIMTALALDWVDFDPLDTLEDLQCFGKWKRRLGADAFNTGEASVFAVADKHNAVAITDDRDATRVARVNGLEVHGNLWVLAHSCRAGNIPLTGAATIVDLLQATGLRLPCSGSGFEGWANQRGLLGDTETPGTQMGR